MAHTSTRRLFTSITLGTVSLLLATLFLVQCGKKIPGITDSETDTGTHIYLASGTTYAGNAVTMSSPSNVISKYNEDGSFNSIIADYSSIPGDSPVAMVDLDSTYLLVTVENALGRRIEKVAKDGSGSKTFIVNSTALSAQMRSLALSADGGYLVSKGTAIEKFSSSKARITQGANAFVQAPGAACATSTTLIPSMIVGPSGSIFMLHAAATPNNKINVINATGYSVVGDCLASIAGPTVNHYPSTAFLHSSGKLFVGFGNTTGPVHDIYQYDITLNSISGATLIGRDASNIQGITAIAELPDGTILVANGSSTYNTIEKFTYASSTLTHVGTTSFIPPSLYTRSISAMVVSN